MKTIAVLTSGGDSPGMNTCVRAVVRTANYYKMKVFAVRNGLQGLIDNDMREFGPRDVSGIVHKGGTILGTARSEEFRTKAGRKKAAENINKRKIDSLVIIGGDGSFRGGIELYNDFDIPFVGLPGTIDNDMYGTDFTIGFDTAVNTAVEAIDKIRDTAESHRRTFFVEVMGRNSGAIALEAGVASGADAVLIPEVKTDLDDLAKIVTTGRDLCKKSTIVVVAEGDDEGSATEIAEKIKEKTGQKYRVCVLGHIQRGGHPSARDRVLATKLGTFAVKSIKEDKWNIFVGEKKGQISYTPIVKITNLNKETDFSNEELVKLMST